MAIDVPTETKKGLLAVIKEYFRTERGEEIGDLQASLFLDFCVVQIGPVIYNQAIKDAQVHLQVAVADLDLVLHEPEAI